MNVVLKLIACICNRSLSLNFKFDVRWVVQVIFKPGSRGESRAPWNRGRVAYCTSLLKKRTFAFRRFKSCRFLQSRERHQFFNVEILVSKFRLQILWGGSSVVRAGFLSRERNFSSWVFPQHTLLGLQLFMSKSWVSKF